MEVIDGYVYTEKHKEIGQRNTENICIHSQMIFDNSQEYTMGKG